MDLEARIKLLKHLEKNFTGFVKHQNAFNNDTEEIIRQLLYNTTQLDTHLVKTKDRLDEVERQQKDIKQKLFKLETEGAIYSYTWQRNEGRFKAIEEQLHIKYLIPEVPSGHPNHEYHKNKLKL
tara:strand:+ start:2539 stop:2910 length:372 start_codon:yes stop_codon:yes gene_type:complete